MPTATLTSKGQITLPQPVRIALGLEAGDKIDFVPEANGGFRVFAVRRDVRELRGRFAGRVARAVSIEEMNAAIEAEAASRHLPQRVLRAAEPPARYQTMRPAKQATKRTATRSVKRSAKRRGTT